MPHTLTFALPINSLTMKDAYIIDGLRTAFGKFRGTLSPIRTDDLLAHVIKELVGRNGNIPAEAYEDAGARSVS